MAANPSAAATERARRRVRRAGGLLREAARDLAMATADGGGIVAELAVVDSTTEQEALALIRLTRARYGELDVVLMPRLARGAHQSGAQAAQETPDHERHPDHRRA